MIPTHECRYCGEMVELPDVHYLQEVEGAIETHYKMCDGRNDAE